MIEGKGSWDDDDAPAPKEEPKEDTNALKDTSIIWFGKHQGKMMSQVPADYLLWLYDDSMLREKSMDPKLKRYIEENRDSLKQEAGIK